jgi:hypothetical protein
VRPKAIARGLVMLGIGQLVLAAYMYGRSATVPAERVLVVAEPQGDLHVEASGIVSTGTVRLCNKGQHVVRIIGLAFC